MSTQRATDDLLAEVQRRYQEWAWDEGFRAGKNYGVASERYHPDRDPEWDCPEAPRNPYTRSQA